MSQAGTRSAAAKAATALARLTSARRALIHPAPAPALGPSDDQSELPRRKSAVHVLSLLLVWLTIASGAYVAIEPAPVDLLTVGLIVLLPAVGLCAISTVHLAYLILWLVVTAAGFVAATVADEVGTATMHMAVSLYLCLASFVFAAFIARRPENHARLIFNAYATAAVVVAMAGVVGYLDLLPGLKNLLTVHSRASAGFKDPNVYSAFLVPPLVYLLHRAIQARTVTVLVPAGGLAMLSLALLVSFSRGAWVNAAVAVLVYGWLSLIVASTNRQRVKLVLLGAFGVAVSALLIAAALEIDAVAKLFEQRASLDQGYDQGPEGRFGGQLKAWDYIIANPLGIGALQFGGILHPEQPHNVYLSMLLYTGWVGGLVYILLIGLTLVWGLSAILRRQWTSPLLVVAYAAFVGLVVEGFVIDTDHWRHFYLVMGLVWGLMLITPRRSAAPALAPARIRTARLVAAAQPRRPGRILGRAPQMLPPGLLMRELPRRRRRRRTPKRKPRIVSVRH
ncbi:MAG TPA: O-antigen ligase family protein [Hyphomicrobiaceae bacterium]|nr:O-antigen ligase family protein [Hyphomicrobiaceae bacterium]